MFHHREDGEDEDASVLSVLSVVICSLKQVPKARHDDHMDETEGGCRHSPNHEAPISREAQIVLHVFHTAHRFRYCLGAALC